MAYRMMDTPLDMDHCGYEAFFGGYVFPLYRCIKSQTALLRLGSCLGVARLAEKKMSLSRDNGHKGIRAGRSGKAWMARDKATGIWLPAERHTIGVAYGRMIPGENCASIRVTRQNPE